MLKEAIDRLVALSEAAATPKVVDLPKEPADAYGLARGGEFEVIFADPPLRQHQVYSLESVMDWGQWLVLPETDREPNRVVVWYNRNGVTALHDGDRRNYARYKLTASEPMLLLQAMQTGQHRTHKQTDFVRLLRIKLAGCVPPAFLEAVRNVVFRQASETRSAVQHGKASLGKAIEAELQGANLVPEEVTIDLPPFENLAVPREKVQCAVDIDAHNEQFTLTPLPGEVEKAWRSAEESVRARLAELVPEDWGGALCYGEP